MIHNQDSSLCITGDMLSSKLSSQVKRIPYMSGHPIDGVQTEFMNEQARLRENILIACREQIHALGVEEKRAMHYKEADALVVILPNDVVVELQNFIEEFAKKLDDYLP